MKNKKPHVSIIITCFNLGEFLKEAVDSALNQTYKDKDILLIDDGSTDKKTIKVIKEIEKENLVKVVRIPNGGVANARNLAISKTEGEYICCLDADDILNEKYIEKVVDTFEKNKDNKQLAVVSSWVQKFGGSNEVWKTREYDPVEVLWSNPIHISSVFKREAFNKLDGYDTKMIGYQDWDLWISLVELSYEWKIIPEKLFLYRVRENSMIKNSDSKRLQLLSYIIDKHSNLYSKYKKELLLSYEEMRLGLEDDNMKKWESKRKYEEAYAGQKLVVNILESDKNNIKMEYIRLKDDLDVLKSSKFFLLRSWIGRLRKNLRATISKILVLFKYLYLSVKSRITLLRMVSSRYSMITLDVFDTLIRRTVYPEEVKLASSLYIALKYSNIFNRYYDKWEIYNRRLEIEKNIWEEKSEYRIEEVLCLLIEYITKDIKADEINKIVEDVIDYEISIEQKVIYPDKFMKNLLDRKLSKENQIFISDFYLGKKYLLKLLNKHYPKLTDGMVSCDYGTNKASGNLFKVFLEENPSLKASEVLHLGDNNHSDYLMPKENGLNAVRYFNLTEELKRYSLKESWLNKGEKLSIEGELDNLSNSIKGNNKTNGSVEQEMFKLGVKYSPIFYSFVLNIIESLKMEGLDKVYFLTREGVFFSRIYEEIIKSRSYIGCEFDVLEVSRMATFFPSVESFSLNGFQRLWSQYKEQSPKSFFKTLDIDIKLVEKFLSKYQIDLDKEVALSTNESFRQLFLDEEFLGLMNDILEKRKNVFSKYLSQKGIVNEYGKKYMIVDIGWRGSIQDNLAIFLDKTIIYGKYLGLHSAYYNSPINVMKSAYGPDYKIDSRKDLDLVNWTGVWEMLSNSDSGSIRGYEDDGSGNIVSIPKEEQSETFVHDKYVKFFQDGVLASIGSIDEVVSARGLSSYDLRNYVFKKMGELVYMPEKVLAEAYFSLNHNETFGLGRFVNMKKFTEVAKINIFKLFLSRKYRKEVYTSAWKSCWRNGFWTLYDINKPMRYFEKLRFFIKGKL